MRSRRLAGRFRQCLLGSLVCLSVLLWNPALAMVQASAEYDDFSKPVVQKEIELLRLNSEFRAHYTQPDHWKQRRMKFYDLIGGSLANAGDIALITQFTRYTNNPGLGLAHKGRLESGAIVVLVAYLTLGGLYATEGICDLASDYKSTRQGWDAKSVVKRAAALQKEIDDALKNRGQAIAAATGLTSAQTNALAAEEKVLTDLRDLSVLEFTRVYIDSRKHRAARDITTIGTLAVCATGAYPGAYGVIRGLEKVNLKIVGGGGIGFIVSGSLLVGAPVLIHGGAAAFGKLSAVELAKQLGQAQTATVATLERDAAALHSLTASTPTDAPLATSPRSYEQLVGFMKERDQFLRAQHERNKRYAIESFVSYAGRGGPQIAFGTLLARAGYHYTTQPSKAFRDIASGAIANETAWAFWMVDTVQKQTRTELVTKAELKNPKPYSADAPLLK